MKNRYKVLPAPDWLTRFAPGHRLWYGAEECLERYEEIAPVFNRPGSYYDRERKYAWIEAHGRAWHDPDRAERHFEWRWKHLDTPTLHPKVRAAIETLAREGLCPRELLEMYRRDRDNRDVRRVGRDVRKRMISFRRERRQLDTRQDLTKRSDGVAEGQGLPRQGYE